jgi:hypothetical protein
VIELASLTDIPAVAELGEPFFREASAPGKFDRQSFIAAWNGLIGSGVGSVHIVRKDDRVTAAFGGVCITDFNTGDPVAMEMFWFADPADRSIENLRLLRRFEEWAAAAGAKRVCMVHLKSINAERLERYYEKRGYVPLETYYWKDLGGDVEN